MFSGAMVLGVSIFHNTLREVILVRLVLMAFLLFLVSLPFLRKRSQPPLREAAA
jgi:hypothetical protein